MFCSKTLQNESALRIVYNELNLNLDKLVELDKSTKIHIKNLITLLTKYMKLKEGKTTFLWIKYSSKKAIVQPTDN